jgi:hypothetical protein
MQINKAPQKMKKFFRAELNRLYLEILEFQRIIGWLKFEIEGYDAKAFLKDGIYIDS